MNESFDKIRELYDSKEYRTALSVLSEMEKHRVTHPSIFVWKSRCLQLTDSPPTELNEIEELLKSALEIDDQYVPALVDLGYFYLRIMDNVQLATPLFERALDICRDMNTSIVIGLTESISETQSTQNALEFLIKNEKLNIDPKKLEELRYELRQGLLG